MSYQSSARLLVLVGEGAGSYGVIGMFERIRDPRTDGVAPSL